VGEEFLRVLLRSSQGHDSGYLIPLTPDQQRMSVHLFEELLGNTSTVGDALHELLWDIIQVRKSGSESTIYTCPVQAWLALHALKPDGTFISSDSLAQLLAKMKYFVKNISMIEVNRRQLDHPDGIIG
jgi:hypothetical protein